MRFPVTAPTRRALLLASAVACLLFLSAQPAHADKMILFKNGKSMRAASVKIDKGWVMADMGKGNKVGVRMDDVLSVLDTSPEAGGPVLTPNRASTEGRGVSRSAGAPDRGDDSEPEVQSSIQERIQQRQQELEERRRQQQEEAQGVQTGPIRGLQPLGQLNQPAGGRGLRRSRFNSNPISGTRADTGISQIQQRDDVEADDGDDDDE